MSKTIITNITGYRQPDWLPIIPTIAIIIIALTLVACASQPTQQPVADPQGVGGSEYVIPDTGYGATLAAGYGAISEAATAQTVFLVATQEAHATSQAITIQQTQLAINSQATAGALQAAQQASFVTATAGVASLQATSAAIEAQATQGAVMAVATAQAQSAVIELQAQQAQAQQAQQSQALISSMTTLGALALGIVGLVAILFFVGNVLQAHKQRARIIELGGQVVQYVPDKAEWLPVISSRALPRPADYAVLESLENADMGDGDSADFIDGVIKVNRGDESYYIPKMTEAEQQARVKALALLVAAMRFHGAGGHKSTIIPGWRQLKAHGLKPRNAKSWQLGAGPLQQAGLIASKPGIGTRIIASEFPDLATLYREINIGTIALSPVDYGLEAEIIENTTKNNW